MDLEIEKNNSIDMTIDRNDNINLDFGGQYCNINYNVLTNKPKINDVTLINNKTSEELGLQDKMEALSVQEIEKILYLRGD